jgi:hypothetical protein
VKDDSDLPRDIRAWSKYDYERAENMKRLEKISVGNRFRLLGGLPLLQEPLHARLVANQSSKDLARKAEKSTRHGGGLTQEQIDAGLREADEMKEWWCGPPLRLDIHEAGEWHETNYEPKDMTEALRLASELAGVHGEEAVRVRRGEEVVG